MKPAVALQRISNQYKQGILGITCISHDSPEHRMCRNSINCNLYL